MAQMSETGEPGEHTFEEHRAHVHAIAYRMLGSRAEADDMVQETWLKWQAADARAIASPKAWLSTVVTRLCLDQLKRARAKRESYVGPWLPEPLPTQAPPMRDAESLSLAFLLLLETLSPVERAVYLLHEAFDYSHGEIAGMLERDEASVRQLFHRARERVSERRPRFAPSREEHQRLLGSFLSAMSSGDVEGLRAMLADNAVAWSDGGGRVRAALNVVRGADAVARLHVGLYRKNPPDPRALFELTEINGWPALVGRLDGRAWLVLAVETDGERVFAVHNILNPDKLARV